MLLSVVVIGASSPAPYYHSAAVVLSLEIFDNMVCHIKLFSSFPILTFSLLFLLLAKASHEA